LNAISVFPNPSSDLIALQFNGLNRSQINLALYDLAGKCEAKTTLQPGQTIAFFDTKTLYNGEYLVQISGQEKTITRKILVLH
jgi:hypothetical protein